MSENIRHLAAKITDLSPLAFDAGEYFNPVGNFSLVRLPNGNWLCQLRRFAYYISTVRQEYRKIPSLALPDPAAHLLLELDGGFNFVRRFNLVGNSYYRDEAFKAETPYLEDGRFAAWGGRFFLSSAIFYQDGEEHYRKFGMEVQEVTISGDTASAAHLWNSVEHGIDGRQKNWMPVPDKPFTFVVGTSPRGARVIDIPKGVIHDTGEYDEADLYRGNTPLLKIGGGYLTITHRLVADDEGRKRYNNHFVSFDDSLRVRHISRPFKLCEANIEFVTELHTDGDSLFIGVTEMDDTPCVMEFPRHRLESLLE